MATKQETFDLAVGGVIKQGGPSVESLLGSVSCRYRGPNGRKCAAGHLIADADYDPMFEGKTVSRQLSYSGGELLECKKRLIAAVDGHDPDLLYLLQMTHDEIAQSGVPDVTFLERFRAGCTVIARVNGLDEAVLA